MLDPIVSEVIAWTILIIITTFITSYFTAKVRLRQQLRFANNLSRPIAFIKNGVELKSDEIRMLKHNWIFQTIDEVDNIQSFTNDYHYWVVVIVYNATKEQDILDLIHKLRSSNLPIIFYTNHQSISKEYMAQVNNYPKMNVTQYSLNLISAIFTILATYNHGK